MNPLKQPKPATSVTNPHDSASSQAGIVSSAVPAPEDPPQNERIREVNEAADAAPGERVPGEDLRARQEKLLDEALEETFPASDPISPKRIV